MCKHGTRRRPPSQRDPRGHDLTVDDASSRPAYARAVQAASKIKSRSASIPREVTNYADADSVRETANPRRVLTGGATSEVRMDFVVRRVAASGIVGGLF